jgi:hypothetical protein
MHTLCPSTVYESQTATKLSGNIALRVTSSSSAYKTRCLDACCQHANVEVTRNTSVIPTTESVTNHFRGSISFLSKQYASILAPAARYSLNNPGSDSLRPWCNECRYNDNGRLVTVRRSAK